MRRPRLVLTAAVLGAGIALTMASIGTAQPTRGEPDAPADPASPMAASRSVRHLLRNGQDYLKYREYERALSFFREAEARQTELGDDERQSLKQGIERALQGLREPQAPTAARASASSATGQLARGRSERPGTIRLAAPEALPDAIPEPPAFEEAPDFAFEPEPVQLIQATVTESPRTEAEPQPRSRTSARRREAPAPSPSPISDDDLPPLPGGLGRDSDGDNDEDDAAIPVPAPQPEPESLDLDLDFGFDHDDDPFPTSHAPAPGMTEPSAPSPIELESLPEDAEPDFDRLDFDLEPAPVVIEPLPEDAEPDFDLDFDPDPEPAPRPAPAETPPAPEDLPLDLEPAPAPLDSSPDAPADPFEPYLDLDDDLPPLPGSSPGDAFELEPLDVDFEPFDLDPPDEPTTSVDLDLGPEPAPTASPDDLPSVLDADATTDRGLDDDLPPLPIEAEAFGPAFADPAPIAPASTPTPSPVLVPDPADTVTEPEPRGIEEAPLSAGPPPQPLLSRRELPAVSAETAPLLPRPTYTSILRPELRAEVDRIARLQEEEVALQIVEPPFPEFGEGFDLPAPRLELPRAPSPTEPRPIRAVTLPEEAIQLPEDIVAEPVREWTPYRMYWAAAATCHMPLYFQDAPLERYGQSVEQALGPLGRFATYPLDDPRQSKLRNQILQPFASAGLFAAQIVLLPYNMIVDPPWEAEYDLGYYRPGDRIPPDTIYLPLTGVGPPLRGRNYGRVAQPIYQSHFR